MFDICGGVDQFGKNPSGVVSNHECRENLCFYYFYYLSSILAIEVGTRNAGSLCKSGWKMRPL